jgi:SAM-dependent methyltransferase
VPFKFRGIGFSFDLSQGLFSSACVDAGTQFLLKVFSKILDGDIAVGKPLPRRVLDAGCGTGVIGICAALALAKDAGDVYARCQDRDELARLVTSHNAAKNNVPSGMLEAFAEPLLAGSENDKWDLILTNIPAKAGNPVLEDFVIRSCSLLNPEGRVIMVVVNTLADFFRELIAAAGAIALSEEKGPGHTVFAYRSETEGPANPVIIAPGFLERYPFYVRARPVCVIEEIQTELETIHGTSGFDKPGGAVLAAAKLLCRLGKEKIPCTGPVLVHEPGQGFFTNWLLAFLRTANGQKLILSGRNILSLEAARHTAGSTSGVVTNTVPAVDLELGKDALLKAGGGKFSFISAFPELLPQTKTSKASQDTDQLTAIWNSLPPLLAEGGMFLAAFSSSDAERFDRKKPTGFTRLGSVKRNGFCALAYRRSAT